MLSNDHNHNILTKSCWALHKQSFPCGLTTMISRTMKRIRNQKYHFSAHYKNSAYSLTLDSSLPWSELPCDCSLPLVSWADSGDGPWLSLSSHAGLPGTWLGYVPNLGQPSWIPPLWNSPGPLVEDSGSSLRLQSASSAGRLVAPLLGSDGTAGCIKVNGIKDNNNNNY